MSDFISQLNALRAFAIRARDNAVSSAVARTLNDPNGALQALDSALNTQQRIDRIDAILLRHAQGTLQESSEKQP